MYSSQGDSWKIADFGLTAEGTSKRAVDTRFARGTSGYRAPELIKNRHYTNKVDIWALGCVVCELLSGHKVFDDDFEVYKFSESKEPLVFHEVVALDGPLNLALFDRLKSMLDQNPRLRPSATGICGDTFWVVPLPDRSHRNVQNTVSNHGILSSMNSIGELIAIDLIAAIMWNTVEFGYHFISHPNLYVEEVRKFGAMIGLQIGIWEATARQLRSPEISKHIRYADLARFAKVSEELHIVVKKFVRSKCANREDSEMKTILQLHSADDLIEQLDEQNILENMPIKEQEQSLEYWQGLKKEVAFLVLKQSRQTKLVTEIVFWGDQLDLLFATVFPSMFSSIDKSDMEQIASIFASVGLEELDPRVQLLLVQSVPSTIANVGHLKLSEANLEISDVTLVDRYGVPGVYIGSRSSSHLTREEDVALELANRTDLGGRERRQWGTLRRDGKKSVVIVEFKSKHGPEDPRHFLPPEYHRGEVDQVIRTLRVASEVKEKGSGKRPFHVLFAEGRYDGHDHFGLVYRLPSLNQYGFQCESLGNILLSPELHRLLGTSLGLRVVLAEALAETLFVLHSVNWVHGSFHSDNILVFAEEVGPNVCFDWSNPYVVGFDSSRTDTGRSGKFNQKAQWTSRIYTHPERDESTPYMRYKKTHDIYALGVVLLELGRLQSFMEEVMEQNMAMKRFHEKPIEDFDKMEIESEPAVEFTYRTTPRDFQNIVEKRLEVLDSTLGPAYRRVVMKCLNSKVLENDNELGGRFRSEVCDQLRLIRNNFA